MFKKNIFIFSLATAVILLDQAAKFLVKANLQLSESIPIIKNALHLTYVTNTGSAFGFFKGLNLPLILFSLIVIAVIFANLKKVKENEKLLQFSVGLLLGGTIGNLIDRLLYGHVIDFIDFRIWPVFNVADSAISVSVVLLVILLWKK